MYQNQINLGESFSKLAKEVLNPEGVLVQGKTERDRALMSKIIMAEDFKAEYQGSFTYFFPEKKESQSILAQHLQTLFDQYGLMVDYFFNKKS